MRPRARITGTGSAVPERKLTNADLERMVDTNHDWIMSRSGIEERRIASSEETNSTFSLPAAQRALDNAEVSGSDVELVICATVTPDMPFPATSCIIQDGIGAKSAIAFDLGAGCSGFVYGLGVAQQFIENGTVQTAVVVGCDMLTKITDFTDRSTCVLFGDGAGAVVLRACQEERGVLGSAMHSDGSLMELIYMPGGGSLHPANRQETLDNRLSYIKMKGNETFKIAVRSLAQVSDEALASCGLGHGDVRWFIPHQANRRIIDAVGQRLEIPDGHTYVNIERFGNTSAASIPIALDELNRANKIDEGDVVLMSAFGAGLTWASAVVRW